MSFLKRFAKRKHNNEIEPEDIFLDSQNVSNLDKDNLEGAFEKSISQNIILLVSFSCICIFSFYLYKLFSLQVIDGDKWVLAAENNYVKRVPIFPKRGVIKDRNGELLAWNESLDKYEDIYNGEIPKRFYIKNVGLSSVLGYVSYPKKDKGGVFWQTVYDGEYGIEKEYNNILSGERGEKIREVSVKGDIKNHNVIKAAKSGTDIETYININIQKSFYKNLKEVVDEQNFNGGAGLLMNVNNGEVLAMASYPDFDNNIFVNATSTEDRNIKANYLSSKRTPMLNRVISGMYVPGSTIKPFMVYAALKENVIDEYKNIYSSGQLVIENKYDGPDTIFRDWKAHGYVDAREAIAVSSDEYFYQIGGGYKDQKGLGINRIENYMKFFGFASSTGIDLPSEKSGVVPSVEWKKKNFKDGEWLLGNTYHTSIGQYGFQTTPLELARAVAVIANGGYLITPKIASTTENNNKEKINLNLDQKILTVAKEGMEMAASSIGTAHYFNNLPFKVAAKTGTAQLGVNNERVNSWSTGYFPADKPEYVFVFLMESGPASNKVGASKIMRKVFDDIAENL